MILAIRKSVFTRGISVTLILVMTFTMIVPINGYTLTGGPAQPEFSSFTPIGTSDMVNLSSGDFSYNIPIMDIGGFPISLAYNSGITTDQEASWVGLGWDLSIGQINRQMRGIPDDFEGDEMTYENSLKPNKTWGASFKFNPTFFGAELPDGGGVLDTSGQFALTLTAQYNNYTGFSLSPSFGVSYDINKSLKIGGDVSSDENGLSLSPSLNYNTKSKIEEGKTRDLKSNIGVAFNSREGLSKVNVSALVVDKERKDKSKTKGIRRQKGTANIGSDISFVNNVYTPITQPGLNTTNFKFKAAIGTEIFGAEIQGDLSGFGSVQKISKKQKQRKVRAFGYEHTHQATKKDVKDFNREKDAGSFSVNTNNLPLSNHSYDIYSVKGQGVSGTFRPYRSQIGYVNDPVSRNYNNGGALGAEGDLGNLVHAGIDYNQTTSQGYSGVWKIQNEAKDELEANSSNQEQFYEEVYFKNVGDLSADHDITKLGALSNKFADNRPIRLGIGITPHARQLKAEFQQKEASNNTSYSSVAFGQADTYRDNRAQRNQNLLKVRKDEVDLDNGDQLLGFLTNSHAKDHHTAGYIVTRNDGARYIYGQALYNTQKEEVSFAVGDGNAIDHAKGQVTYNHGTDNSLNNSKGLDHFYSRVSTPAYAHTYLLTLLVSTDYSDLTGDGPTDDDLGSYTKFTYTDPVNYQWKVPCGTNIANYNEGLKTDKNDDRGSYLYGQKEIRYIEKIETKTHIAFFYTLSRDDARGVTGEEGTIGGVKKQRLKRIELYSKEDLDDNGVLKTGAVPIKTAHFDYKYTLCPGTPNSSAANGGKLTLDRVYFTYRNSNMGKYSAYKFNYPENASENPTYHLKGYDIWGGYKEEPASGDPTNPEFNYVEQNTQQDLTDLQNNVRAWTLKSIELPSGGTIEIEYESDDYAYVQDKKAMRMFKVCGAGNELIPSSPESYRLFGLPQNVNNTKEATYLYIKLPDEDVSITGPEFVDQYLADIIKNQERLVQFRFMLNMTKAGGQNSALANNKDQDYVSGYFELDTEDGQCGVFTNSGTAYGRIALRLVPMEGGFGADVNPIAKAGWQFGRSQLSKYIYGHPDQDEGIAPAEILEDVILLFDNLLDIFTGPNGTLRRKKIARRFDPKRSWIRLSNPNGHKKGGGSRVKSIKMHDNWDEMSSVGSNQYYGQEYSYELTDGTSSGVATYEPIGSKENPFVQPVFTHVRKLLAPDIHNYIEKPFGESFFPSPTVTYSRVEVKNLERKTATKQVKSHATGKVITEFYTSKDFPVLTDQTNIDVRDDGGGIISSILNINNFKSTYLSQGYVIHINDMDGKMKSQRVYGEGQATPISGADYLYNEYPASTSNLPASHLFSNNRGKLNNTVYTLDKDGYLKSNTIGVETDITNDFREKRSSTQIVGVNGNVGSVIAFIPVVVPAPFPTFALHRDKIRMASTTKVINTFGLLKETIAYDAGARVSTKNLVWDDQTGEVLVTETTNEYDESYYSFNYPAFWYYDGMGAASRNAGIELEITGMGLPSGQYSVQGQTIMDFLYEGDEVLLYNTATANQKKYGWVKPIGVSGVTQIIDRNGIPIGGMNRLKVIRSGRRNLMGTSMASVTLQENPVDIILAAPGDKIPTSFLRYDLNLSTANDEKVINAGSVEFSDDWIWDEGEECGCNLPNENTSIINEFVFNRKGVWRALRSYLYLTGREHTRKNTTANTLPDPRQDGFYTAFKPYYFINGSGNWDKPQPGLSDWTSTSTVTRYSPYGFELENKDALNRYSSAQYGYNFKFPMAVSANSKYSQMGFDGFEDYTFSGVGCAQFNFFNEMSGTGSTISSGESHTGKYSIKVPQGQKVEKIITVE